MKEAANIIDIEEIRSIKASENNKRILDAKASLTVISQCLKFIEMNSMPELRNVKAIMRKTMHQLKNIGKNERR